MKIPPWQIRRKNPNWAGVLEDCIKTIRMMADGGDIAITVSDIVRSLDQNDKMWPMLTDFARQVPMVVNGERMLVEKEDWKAVLTAAFEEDARMAIGLNGGIVMLGARTSKFSRAKMAEFITFMYAEGNERGVQWSERSLEHIARYGESRAAA